jgi:hypothetical protein
LPVDAKNGRAYNKTKKWRWNKMTDKIKALREMVEASSRIVAFTGAGCSTESGIADFRSSPGELANLGTNAPMSTESGAIVPIF